MIEKKPLVSIIIPNRNHSVYLGQAIESALAQTYKNTEIIICDNCSDDNSLEVAMKYLDRGIIINKNPINILNNNYKILASLATGKYFILLCADDIIKPTFIERAVSIMEEHSNIGYLHCERDYIDETGNIIELDPFFTCSFISPGESMLPIYMLTDVGQAAQALIRRSSFDYIGGHDTDTDHLNIDRELWFRLSMVSDYVYLREKLSLIRIHNSSETAKSTEFFVHPLSIYAMIKGFVEWAKIKNYKKVLEREKIALNKLAVELLNSAISCLRTSKIVLAKQHMLLASIVDNSIVENESYGKCLRAINDDDVNVLGKSNVTDSRSVFHARNYNPPENFIKL